METLGIPKTVHNHIDLLAPELRLDAFESTFQAEPEVNLLRCRSRGDVTSELGHGLDGLDPLIDMALQGVEEGAVVQLLGRYIGDTRPGTGCASLLYYALDDRVNDEMRLWNLDILLQME